MSKDATTIKSFTLDLDKTVKGKPQPVKMCCVYSNNVESNMGIGYVLGVGPNITEARCFNLGLKDVHSFMNTDEQKIGNIVCFRLGFTDGHHELSGFMMQGPDGDDIVATANWDEKHLEEIKAHLHR